MSGAAPGPVRPGADPTLEALRRGSRSRLELFGTAGGRAGRGAIADGFVSVFVVGTPDPTALASLDVRPGARVGRILSARVPLGSLDALLVLPGVERVTIARGLAPNLDASVKAVRADTLRTRVGDEWTGWTGEGAIIGLVDSGLDLEHMDFRRPDETTRVLAYWDQTDPIGPPPTGRSYGTEWSAAQIDNGFSRAGDEEGHGTTVAGVATGDGSASQVPDLRYRYAGIAPGADLVVVDVEGLLETSVLDAVQYVFDRAEALGRPAVVNLSLGTQFGPHDGTTPFEQGLDALVGPGRLIVASAGNEGNDFIHAEMFVPAGESDSVEVTLPGYNPSADLDVFFVDAWYDLPDSMAVTVVTPGGTRIGPVGMNEVLIDVLTGEGTLFLGQGAPDSVTGSVEIGMDVSNIDPDPDTGPTPPPPEPGVWRIVCTNLAPAPGAGTGEVDLWIPFWIFPGMPPPSWPTWTLGYDPTEEIASPGTAAGVLTVGSFNSKGSWLQPDSTLHHTGQDSTFGAPSYFTSRGPTRDGRPKPEVIAPGFVITSSLSHDVTPEYLPSLSLEVTGNPDGEHYTQVGTSLSAPHLTGALALWLEREPDLTPETVRNRLEMTSVADAATGPVWNPAAGYGRLDVAALLDGVVPVRGEGVILSLDGDGRPRLEWAEPDDAVRAFRVERSLAGGPWVRMVIVSATGERAWTDADPQGPARYRVLALLADGSSRLWGEVSWGGAVLPPSWLGAPHPNPFVARTRAEVRSAPGELALDAIVLDARGRLVRRLVPVPEAGTTWVEWDGTDAAGRRAAAGVYWLRVRRGGESRTAKLVLSR